MINALAILLLGAVADDTMATRTEAYAAFDAMTRSEEGEWRALSALDGCTLFFRSIALNIGNHPSRAEGTMKQIVVDLSEIARSRPAAHSVIVFASGDRYPVASAHVATDGYDDPDVVIPSEPPPPSAWATIVTSEDAIEQEFPDGKFSVKSEETMRFTFVQPGAANPRTLWQTFNTMVEHCQG